MKSTTTTLALALSLAAGLTACGGGSKGSGGAGSDATLAYKGKTDVFSFAQLSTQQINQIGALLVEHHTLYALTEVNFAGLESVLDEVWNNADDNSFIPSTNASIVYDSNMGPEYCGGTGTFTVSSDYYKGSTSVKAFSENKAVVGILELTLDKYCNDNSLRKLLISGSYKETYEADAVTTVIKVNQAIEWNDLNSKCDLDLNVYINREEDLSKNEQGMKCPEGETKMINEMTDVRLKAGDKSRYDDLKRDFGNLINLANFGKLGYDAKDISYCYDSSAKVTRLKEGSIIFFGVVYDVSSSTYVADGKYYTVDISQTVGQCKKPTLNIYETPT